MRRAPFSDFAKGLREQGFSEEKIREVLEKLIREGYAEGNDAEGYIITEKGVTEIEKMIFKSVGVV